MTNMTKEQLEQLLSCTLTDFECGRIKECISYFSGDYELFQTKDDIVKFYRAFGIDGIYRLHCHHVVNEEMTESYRADARENFGMYVDAFAKYTVVCKRYGIPVDEIPYDAPIEETHEDEIGICQPFDMDALKEHFESITNCTVSDSDYSKIEKCITAFSGLLASDNDIALFYHTFGINGIDHLLSDLAGFKAVEDLLCEKAHAEHGKYLDVCIKNSQLSTYITAFLKALVKFFNKILNDPLFSSNYNNSDYTRAFFVAFIDYLNYEVERFESEVK